jgi:MFS family permease
VSEEVAEDPRPRSDEDEKARIDRELLELLNELRVALPGVQVLFAFLLILPFQQFFEDLTRGQRAAYFASFLLTALAVALLIAPSSYHRLRFRHGDKKRMLISSNRMFVSGLLCTALAMSLVVYLVTDVLFGVSVAAAIAAAITLWFAWFWYGLPLSRRLSKQL